MKGYACLAALVGTTLIASGCAGSRRTAPPPALIRAVTEIPSRLPRGGVSIQDGDIVLTRWTSTPRGAMSEHQAIAAALVFANKATAYPRRALKADLTQPGTIPPGPHVANNWKNHVPVWVVTFTSPKPVDVGAAGPVYAKHYSVAVNAVTGKFVLGFFEH